MATRKTASRTKSPSVASPPPAAPTAREFAVVLEDIHSQFAVFGESLAGFRDSVERRFDEVDRRFEGIDRRLDRMDERFDGIDGRLDRMDERFDGIESDLGLVKLAVLENSREIKELRKTTEEKLEP